MDINYENPIVQMLRDRQITPDYLGRIAIKMGYSNMNEFLAYFEKEQVAEQYPIGAGEGTSASEVEHYINLSGNDRHNPGQTSSPGLQTTPGQDYGPIGF